MSDKSVLATTKKSKLYCYAFGNIYKIERNIPKGFEKEAEEIRFLICTFQV